MSVMYRTVCRDVSSLLRIFLRLVPIILLGMTILFYFQFSNIARRFPVATWTNIVGHENASVVDRNLEGGSRLLQASMLFGGKDKVFERAMRTHVQHGERWGYRTKILRHDVVGQGEWKVLLFGKLLYLQSLIIEEMAKSLAKRAEWIVWFDADTIILNENIPWTIFLPPSGPDLSHIHHLGNKDWNGYNCGVFFLHVNEWSVNFLAQAIALPLLRPEVSLGHNIEQDAMVWVLNQPGYKENVLYQPREWYNGFQYGGRNELEVSVGDLLIHFAGAHDKVEPMGRWLDRLDNSPQDLQIPLNDTSVLQDVTKFWSNIDVARRKIESASALSGRMKDTHPDMFAALTSVPDSLSAAQIKVQTVMREHAWNAEAMQVAIRGLEDTIQEVSGVMNATH